VTFRSRDGAAALRLRQQAKSACNARPNQWVRSDKVQRERVVSGLPPKADLRCARSCVRALNRGSAARRHRTASLSARPITVSPVGECNEERDPSDFALLDIAAADRFGA
jgi:hypothetical protein